MAKFRCGNVAVGRPVHWPEWLTGSSIEADFTRRLSPSANRASGMLTRINDISAAPPGARGEDEG